MLYIYNYYSWLAYSCDVEYCVYVQRYSYLWYSCDIPMGGIAYGLQTHICTHTNTYKYTHTCTDMHTQTHTIRITKTLIYIPWLYLNESMNLNWKCWIDGVSYETCCFHTLDHLSN